MNIQTSVSFQTSYELLQKLMDSAEKKILNNLKHFDSRLVLIEGGGYEKNMAGNATHGRGNVRKKKYGSRVK